MSLSTFPVVFSKILLDGAFGFPTFDKNNFYYNERKYWGKYFIALFCLFACIFSIYFLFDWLFCVYACLLDFFRGGIATDRNVHKTQWLKIFTEKLRKKYPKNCFLHNSFDVKIKVWVSMVLGTFKIRKAIGYTTAQKKRREKQKKRNHRQYKISKWKRTENCI